MWHGLVIWDLRTSAVVATLERNPLDVEDSVPYTCATVSEDGRRFILGTRRGRLAEWTLQGDEWRQGATVNIVDPRSSDAQAGREHSPWLCCLLIVRGRSVILSGWDDGTIAIHDHHTLQRRTHHSDAHRKCVSRLLNSPTSPHVLSASWDGSLKLWTVTDSALKCVRPFPGHGDKDINNAAFSHDGKLIASGSDDRTVRVWGVDGNPDFLSLVGHESPVRSVHFSPRGDRLVSCASDDTVRVWDSVTGKVINVYKGSTQQEGGIRSVAFNWDGTEIASLSLDGVMRQWDEWETSTSSM